MKKLVFLLSVAAAFGATACSDPQGISDATLPVPQHGLTTQIPPDPCPGCDGVWIGYSYDECLTSLSDDQDHDGFRDTCERRLAEFFRPYLVMSSGDNTTGHEPYWAVTSPGNLAARVFWAFAYYWDGGANGFGCTEEPTNSCDGHPGDSEYLTMDLFYDSSLSHWTLNFANYTQHGSDVLYRKDDLEYRGTRYGYPTVYVAFGKHANYSSDSECDAGQFFYDNCQGDYELRDSFSAYHNLGTNSYNLQNCVTSEGEYFGTGHTECFWTDTVFGGWTDLYTETAPYGPRLRAYQFVTAP